MNAIKKLANLVGPRDPNNARKINPQSLRALFGEDILKNACQCSKNQQTFAKFRDNLFFDQNIQNHG